jgi:hypothetical protein
MGLPAVTLMLTGPPLHASTITFERAFAGRGVVVVGSKAETRPHQSRPQIL